MATELERNEEKKNRFWAEVYDWGESICISLAVVMFLFTFCFQNVEVWGPSMEVTLHGRDITGISRESGDKLLISNLFYTPEYGDIVVIRSEGDEKSIIKRVIATAGQQVDIDSAAGVVKVDGKVLTEDYVSAPTYATGNVVFPVTVPKGCVFVLGDNRPVSMDSRFTNVGMVDTDNIMGRVVLRIYPFAKFGTVK